MNMSLDGPPTVVDVDIRTLAALTSVPQEFKDAFIVHLYKRQGNQQCCGNHRRISLLSIARKILAQMLLNR